MKHLNYGLLKYYHHVLVRKYCFIMNRPALSCIHTLIYLIYFIYAYLIKVWKKIMIVFQRARNLFFNYIV